VPRYSARVSGDPDENARLRGHPEVAVGIVRFVAEQMTKAVAVACSLSAQSWHLGALLQTPQR